MIKQYKNRLLAFIVIFLAFQGIILGQSDSNNFQLTYSNKSLINTKPDSVAFWGWANKAGVIDRNSNNILNSIYLSTPSINLFWNLNLSAETELVARISKKSSVFFPRVSAKFDIENFDLKIGKFLRSQVRGQEKDLTIGSMLVSENADPYWGYNLESKRYLSVPLLQGYIKYEFSFGDYILPDSRYNENVLFHSKDFYLQLELGNYKVSAGIIHNSYWAGVTPGGLKLPSGLSNYKRIVFNNSGGSDAWQGERINRLGNSVSGYDYAMSYDFGDFWVQISKLFFIEDRPASRHRSPWDGQWNTTFEFSNSDYLDYVVYDHVNTKRQDSKFFEPNGRANYYTHAIYKSGFSNRNYVLGNPLIRLNFLNNGAVESINNVLVAHHLGIKGNISNRINFSQRITYSRNYGNCFDQLVDSGSCNFEPDDDVELKPLSELRKDSFNLSSQLIYFLSDLKRSEISIALNFDFGDFENNFGFVFGFKTSLINQIEN